MHLSKIAEVSQDIHYYFTCIIYDQNSDHNKTNILIIIIEIFYTIIQIDKTSKAIRLR